MGNQTLTKAAIFQFIEEAQRKCQLNKTESSFYETSLFTTANHGPIVGKYLLKVKSDEEFRDLETEYKRIHDTFKSSTKFPNFLTYFKECPVRFKDLTILMRQYVSFNLHEKLRWMPQLLSDVEKKWLVFQLLCALVQIHSRSGMVHGDIKPENILVTSYGWLVVSDLNPYKPTQLMDDDLKTYNVYFGDLDNNIRCYLAPERWISPPQTANSKADLAPAMDIYSAGCVIAEILLDGLPLFDLARAQNYRKGDFDPREELKKAVGDDIVVKLICQMIDRDPAKRPLAWQCLLNWCNAVFPQCFLNCFYQIGASFLNPEQLYSDNRISLIRYHIDSIFEKCFEVFDAQNTEGFQEPIEPTCFQIIKTCDTLEQIKIIDGGDFHFSSRTPEAIEKEKRQFATQNTLQKEGSREAGIIILHMIGQIYPSCFFPQSKIVALELMHKISKYLPFSVKLGQVLPLLQKAFENQPIEGALERTVQVNSQAKVRVKALEVMLALFDEILDCTDQILIEPTDFRVFQNYILPIIKKLMEQSKAPSEITVRLAIARNLGRIAKVGMCLLELAIGSCNKRKEDAAARKKSASISTTVTPKGEHEEGEHFKQHMPNPMMTTMFRTSTLVGNQFALRREDLQLENVGQISNEHYEEEMIQGPNYDFEVQLLWDEVVSFIQSFSVDQDSAALIALLQNLTQLSIIFGVEKSDFLMQQCLSAINRKDFHIKMEVIKTLSGLSLRVGQKKCAEYVLPITESLLEDPEDLVILEDLKMLNQFAKLRLLTRKQALNLYDKLLPFLLHPNRQIREHAVKYITTIATIGHTKLTHVSGKYSVVEKPLFPAEDFFCFLRPKLLQFLRDGMDIFEVKHEKDLLSKLKPALSVKVMKAYFSQFAMFPITSIPQRKTQPSEQHKEAVSNYQKAEIEFIGTHCHTNEDSLAFTALSVLFQEKLRQIKQKMLQAAGKGQMTPSASFTTKGLGFAMSLSTGVSSTDPMLQLQNSLKNPKVYRVLKTSALKKLVQPDVNPITKLIQSQAASKEKKEIETIETSKKETLEARCINVQSYQNNDPCAQLVLLKGEPAIQTNYGLNLLKSKSAHVLNEVDSVLEALSITPDIPETHTLNYTDRHFTTDIKHLGRQLRVSSELKLAQQGAQPSLLAHFDPKVDSSSKEYTSLQITEDHLRTNVSKRNAPFPQIKPTGTLITTLHEHKNPVNTIAVSNDHQFFLTGSREEKVVHIWKTDSFENDSTSRPVHSFSTGDSPVNQICMLQKSRTVAVAGKGGLRIYDLERSLQNQSDNQTEVVQNWSISTDHEVSRAINFLTPVSAGQHLLCASTVEGGFFIHDLRAQRHVVDQQDVFGCRRGFVTNMCIGQNGYQLAVGTLGGYVMIYDIRYSVVSSLYRHNFNYPIMAMSTANFRRTPDAQFATPSILVSAGSPNMEVAQFNLQTGNVDLLLRCSESQTNSELNSNDLPSIPEFVRETNFKDNKFGTLKRESNIKMFQRSMLAVRSGDVFNQLMNGVSQDLIKNIDAQLLDVSRQRFKLIFEAYKSPNACRSILVPRSAGHHHVYDSETANYVLTAGNDRKIRYWSLTDPENQSYQINSPNDDEVTYQAEKLARGVKVIQERFSKSEKKNVFQFTQQRLNDRTQVANYNNQQMKIDKSTVLVKYGSQSAYMNMLANLLQTKLQTAQAQNSNNIGFGNLTSSKTDKDAGREMGNFFEDHVQYEKVEGPGRLITGVCGLSEGQHMNNLAIYGSNFTSENPSKPISYPTQSSLSLDAPTERMLRTSDIVSHSDTILDMAMLYPSQSTPFLVTCSRDNTVKLWK